MRFLKEHFHDILRLYINQIGITIFSLVLYFSISSITDEALSEQIKAAVSLFSILFFFVLIYTASWDYGAKDKIRVDGGRAKPMPLKGFIMGLAANSLNFLLAALCIVLYAFTETAFFAQCFDICNILLRFTAAMYIGILQLLFDGSLWQAIGFLILPLFAVGVTHLGYTLGSKEIKLFSPKKSTDK